jgi:hypothetical protein
VRLSLYAADCIGRTELVLAKWLGRGGVTKIEDELKSCVTIIMHPSKIFVLEILIYGSFSMTF